VTERRQWLLAVVVAVLAILLGRGLLLASDDFFFADVGLELPPTETPVTACRAAAGAVPPSLQVRCDPSRHFRRPTSCVIWSGHSPSLRSARGDRNWPAQVLQYQEGMVSDVITT
jgi:hypothetical protein